MNLVKDDWKLGHRALFVKMNLDVEPQLRRGLQNVCGRPQHVGSLAFFVSHGLQGDGSEN